MTVGPPASICSTQEDDNDEGVDMAAVAVSRCPLELPRVPKHSRKAVSHPALSRLPWGSLPGNAGTGGQRGKRSQHRSSLVPSTRDLVMVWGLGLGGTMGA